MLDQQIFFDFKKMGKCLLDKEIWLIQGIAIIIFKKSYWWKTKLLVAAFATFVAVDG